MSDKFPVFPGVFICATGKSEHAEYPSRKGSAHAAYLAHLNGGVLTVEYAVCAVGGLTKSCDLQARLVEFEGVAQ
jgi:hypothetical protein